MFLFCGLSIFILPNKSEAQFYKKIISSKAEDGNSLLLSEYQVSDIGIKLKLDINYLSSQRLRERSTGSAGEKAAGMYIQTRMEQAYLSPFQKTFRHSFKFISGKYITPETKLKLSNKFVFVPEEAFPVTFSGPTDLDNFVLPNVTEAYSPWLVPLYPSQTDANNPSFDWEKSVYERSQWAIKRKASAVLFYDQYGAKRKPEFSKTTRYETLGIPVIILQKKAYEEHILGMNTIQPLYANVKFRNDYQEGNNVTGLINNNAKKTIVITAPYDRSDLQDGAGKDILNIQELNNDASGLAALLSLAKVIKESSFTNYNYIFVALSGSRQGNIGIEYFLKSLNEDTAKIAFVFHLDQLASLDEKRELFVYNNANAETFDIGFALADSMLKIKRKTLVDINETHTTFNEKGIPAVYFSSISADHNYNPTYISNIAGVKDIVQYLYAFLGSINQQYTPGFVTLAQSEAKPAAKITLKTPLNIGVQLDEEFDKIGVLIKAVDKNSAAEKAGILPGDILFQIGSSRVDNEETFKSVLQKYKKNDTAKIKVKRGVTVQLFNIVF